VHRRVPARPRRSEQAPATVCAARALRAHAARARRPRAGGGASHARQRRGWGVGRSLAFALEKRLCERRRSRALPAQRAGENTDADCKQSCEVTFCPCVPPARSEETHGRQRPSSSPTEDDARRSARRCFGFADNYRRAFRSWYIPNWIVFVIWCATRKRKRKTAFRRRRLTRLPWGQHVAVVLGQRGRLRRVCSAQGAPRRTRAPRPRLAAPRCKRPLTPPRAPQVALPLAPPAMALGSQYNSTQLAAVTDPAAAAAMSAYNAAVANAVSQTALWRVLSRPFAR